MSESSKSVFDSFEQRIIRCWPIDKWRSVSVLVAVSGGPDSVALLRALHKVRTLFTESAGGRNSPDPVGRFEVAHFNHRWRGRASSEDESFVSDLCREFDIQCHVGHTQQETDRTEEIARNERYAFLQQTAEQRGARYLVTAHTASDQAETILHRVLRGTGLRGLRGIQFARKLSQAVTVVRPMLSTSRREVMSYLERNDQGFRIDSSNEDCNYTRNRIRQELLPQLTEQYNPSTTDALLRIGKFATEALRELEPLIHSRAEACCVNRSETVIELQRATFVAESEFMQREILVRLWRNLNWPEQSMSFERWSRMVHSIREEAVECFPGGVRLSFERGRVRLWRLH